MADDQVATRQAIADALARFADGDIAAESKHLLGVLGYRSERTIANQTGDVDAFLTNHPALNPNTKSETDFLSAAASVHLVFQVADEEIAAAVQQSILTSGAFDSGIARSFIFVAVELSGNHYPRGTYAQFTREINKRFTMPVVVLFRAAEGSLTAAFVHRRIHKRDAGRDVLGSVSLIREINPVDPHRAHIDILEELTLDKRLKWIGTNRKPQNFDGLLAAWLDALDTEALNKCFYNELFEWFGRACDAARFPTGGTKAIPPEEHVIRLITRLLFVWFIKEKGLVAGDLFIENQVQSLLKDYDRARGDSYYRAVLQNLFFATLNTEIDRRGFSSRSNATHRDFSRYRYAAEMADQNALQSLFDRTPFINGGLFDCLDSELAPRDGGYRIDYFTDNVIRPGAAEYQRFSVPNHLFFDDDERAPGLIALFNRYKFTVEENTPVEQEVALDPELLGKVFENLLAANTPETQKSARKQTGTYYTPRPVVDYMVEQALTASLLERIKSDDVGEVDTQRWRDRIQCLFDYDDEFNATSELFDEKERNALVRAIAQTTMLDPAVGSGAFPMGVLHKLTLALRRLDPDNKRWKKFQLELALQRSEQAYELPDQGQRDERLIDISATFDRYGDSDYGRKLYLIQNSIYGLDIQPIATQIAKLRFFISLAIEQQPTSDPEENYGIQPLPNLETRFVAADSLLGLDLPLEPTFGDHVVMALQQQLAANRERHFHAANRSEKLNFRRQDAELRRRLADALRDADFSADAASKIAQWDPYDQNIRANWFDPEWMFGINDGFDVVIGNPPYAQVRKGTYSAESFPYSEGKDPGKQNLYKLFVELSYNMCGVGGVGTMIVQSSLMCDQSAAATRQLLLEQTNLKHIIEFPKDAATPNLQVFKSVTQGTCIYQFTKRAPGGNALQVSIGNDSESIENVATVPIDRSLIVALYPELRCFPLIRQGYVKILRKIASTDSVRPLREFVHSISQGDFNLSTYASKYSEHPTSVLLLRGKQVGRFAVKYGESNEYCTVGFREAKIEENRIRTFLLSQQVTGTTDARRIHVGVAANAPTDFLCGHSINKTLLKNEADSSAFAALLNSTFLDWYFRVTSTNNNVQGYELEQLPIPALSTREKAELGRLADHVLAERRVEPSANTSLVEAEIDKLVYSLYGLTEEEIATVEARYENDWP